MLQTIAVLSLSITGIHAAFQQGNVLGWLRIAVANWLDKVFGVKVSRYVQKPLWDCLPCMASVWTIVLTVSINVPLILGVCGLNACIERLILSYDGPAD